MELTEPLAGYSQPYYSLPILPVKQEVPCGYSWVQVVISWMNWKRCWTRTILPASQWELGNLRPWRRRRRIVYVGRNFDTTVFHWLHGFTVRKNFRNTEYVTIINMRTYAFRLRASMESFISVVASSDGILLWSIKWFSYILASAREYRGVTSLNIYLPVETSTVTGNFLLFPGCGISSCNMRSMNLLDKDVHMTWFNPIIHDRCATAIDLSSPR